VQALLVHYLFIISSSVVDCLQRFVSEMTCYVLSGTLDLSNYLTAVLRLFRFFNIPIHVLPKICTSSEIYGHLSDTVLAGIPISGVSKYECISLLPFNVQRSLTVYCCHW